MDANRISKPKLLILSPVTRADLEGPLENFRKFEIWHLYHKALKDIPLDRMNTRSFRFRNLLDAFIKTMRIRPSVIQGSEPYYLPWGFILSALTMLAAKLLEVPYFFPMFENLPPEVKFRNVSKRCIRLDWFLVPLLRSFMTVYARGAKLIFTPNRGARQHLAAIGIPKRKVVSNLYANWGVDLKNFSPRRDGTEPRFGRNTILFVGRIVEQKGIKYLLEAFLAVRKQISDAKLVFIGDGPLVTYIRKFVRQHALEDAVSLLGVIYNQDLPRFFRAARVVAQPSITIHASGRTTGSAEQLGMVNIQSIACGTPVVSTTSGSISEFTEDQVVGLLVPERNSEALVRALIRLLQDSILYQRMSAAGRKTSIERYDRSKNIIEAERIILSRVLRQTT